MSTVTVIGDGGWGTALGLVLHRNGHAVRIWGPSPEYIARINTTRRNPRFLPGIALPDAITWTADPADAIRGAEMAVLAVPSRYYRSVLEGFRASMPAETLLVSVSKGFEQESGERLSATAGRIFPKNTVAVLSGPSHAEEVARGIPTAVVTAATDPAAAHKIQDVFNGGAFRVYTSDDPVGVELGGALKNVVALAAGISDGIGYGDNTKAALMTRGLVEMARLGVALGARRETFAGLSGMGDLVVTCTSRHSRNRALGERLGRGEKLEAILKGMEQVAEGVWTCPTAVKLAESLGVEVPIMQEVNSVLYHGKSPRTAVEALLRREPRPERD